MLHDLASNIDPVGCIFPAAAITDNTPLVSSIIDTLGYEGFCLALITGTDADTDATFALTAEHGDTSNLADTAAPAATDLIGTLAQGSYTFSDDNKTRKLGYIGSKRYLRFTITPSGNTGNVFLAATGILGYPKVAPTPTTPV